MRHAFLATLVLLTSAAYAEVQPASCRVEDFSIAHRSPTGIAQVTNRTLIEIRCTVAARPVSTKPGEGLAPLTPATSALQLPAQPGAPVVVPSDVQSYGGGSGSQQEWVGFYLYLPLDPTERDAEATRYFDRMLGLLPTPLPPNERSKALANMLKLAADDPSVVSQTRTGHFLVECRLLDGSKVVGLGTVELEVLFKSRFSDTLSTPGSWEAPAPTPSLKP